MRQTKTKMVDWFKFEQYKEMFKEHFVMERREDGVILIRMHTQGGPQTWSMELHRAIGQMWRIVGTDSENEVAIFTGTGHDWIIEFEPASWEPEITEPEYTRYEHMFVDGRRMLIALIQDVEFPTIGALNGDGGHTELALMCDIAIMADDIIIGDPHFAYDIVPGDGIHSCFFELMGTRKGAYYMLTSKNLNAQEALAADLVCEVVPRERLIPRAYEIADFIMARHRTVRRLTAQLVRRPWKQRIVDDLDMAFGTEMFGDFCKNVEHSNIKSRDWFLGDGSKLFHDEARAKKTNEESKATEKTKYTK